LLTSEYVQCDASIVTSIGEVWLATQNPQFFGLYSSLWKLMTAESDRQMMRNPINDTASFIQRRAFAFGTHPTIPNASTNHTTFYRFGNPELKVNTPEEESCARFTHPNEANDDSERHKKKVTDQKSNNPNDCQLPRDELVAAICSCKKIPVLQFLRLETRRNIIFDDRFHARLDVFEAIFYLEVYWLNSFVGIFLKRKL
jgi:hypothetical protein